MNKPQYIKPINLVEVSYAQTGQSKKLDALGMREMQAKAYEARTAKYLLLKAPPASGKSRALMFIALDKLINQGIKKAIIAVPERSIGNSFSPIELTKYGFFANWELHQRFNLCTPGNDKSKVQAFLNFLQSEEKILICTHATLRFAFEGLTEKDLDDCLIVIDEFHHVSADGDNRLGEVIRNIMQKSNAQIIAMTGSYFRGDSVPVLLPEDEEKFTKVTYNYYDQLNGYEHLKSLGIGYHFYQGRYYKKQPDREMSALEEILDENLKTIIHIPSVNSAESSKEKIEEVSHIIDCIGEMEYQDSETGILYIKSKRTGRILKIADLVNDIPKEREKVVAYLRGVSNPDDIDIIIALGMAKEGFDWPFCEHALTIGYRGSLTEIIQIIGRATRDSENKTHAQFTNLIAQPDAVDDDVKLAVNNMLKAITASLLMEQVLAPNFKFKPKFPDDEEQENDNEEDRNTIKIKGFKLPTTQRAKDIITSDLNDLKARILQDDTMLKAMPGNIEPEVINTVLIPKIIREVYPSLNEEDIEAIRQYVVVDSVIKNSTIEEQGNKKFIRMAGSFVNMDDIHIDLIDTINPFQKAFEILSKSVTTSVLKAIQDTIAVTKIDMTEEEAILLWPKIKEWVTKTGDQPNMQSFDPKEQRMAQALIFLREEKEKERKMAKTLDDIFNDDDSGLLNSKDKSSNHKTDEDRLIDSFEEINTFFEKHNREPSTDNMSEYNLLARLKGFRNDESKKKILKPFDRFDLLGYVEMEKKTFDEILEEDNLGLLNTDADTSIFEFKHTPKQKKRAETDFVAQRQAIPEKEFKKYELLFQQVHRELKEGKRKLLNFENIEKNLQIDNYYLLDGLMLYLESAELESEVKNLRSGNRFRIDGRTVAIFENGTRSNLLFRSLGKAIQKDGKLITTPDDSYFKEFSGNSNIVSEEDIQSGRIYVLKSKSSNSQITDISNLYKIGFSTVNVGDRIKNAHNEATYLFANVEIIASYRCYNLNTQHFENLIHRFFGSSCLNIDVFDRAGNRYMPREWFIAPLNIIEQAVHLIISGGIVKYKYDAISEEIVPR